MEKGVRDQQMIMVMERGMHRKPVEQWVSEEGWIKGDEKVSERQERRELGGGGGWLAGNERGGAEGWVVTDRKSDTGGVARPIEVDVKKVMDQKGSCEVEEGERGQSRMEVKREDKEERVVLEAAEGEGHLVVEKENVDQGMMDVEESGEKDKLIQEQKCDEHSEEEENMEISEAETDPKEEKEENYRKETRR